MPLYAGVRYKLKVEHTNDGGNGVAVLLWETPTRPLAAIDQVFFTYGNDVTAPGVRLTAPASTPLNTAFQVIVEPTEPWVQAPPATAIVVDGGVAGSLTPNSAGSFNLLITPNPDAAFVRVSFLAGAFKDAAGNDSVLSDSTETRVGPTPTPTALLSGLSATPNALGPFSVETSVAHLQVEQSADLRLWKPLDATAASVSSGADPAYRRVSVPLSSATPGSRYFRLKVVR